MRLNLIILLSIILNDCSAVPTDTSVIETTTSGSTSEQEVGYGIIKKVPIRCPIEDCGNVTAGPPTGDNLILWLLGLIVKTLNQLLNCVITLIQSLLGIEKVYELLGRTLTSAFPGVLTVLNNLNNIIDIVLKNKAG